MSQRIMSQRKLIVVSNRLPVQLARRGESWQVSPSGGGLVSALSGIKSQLEFDWVGWPGADVPKKEQDEVTEDLRKMNAHPVFLSSNQIDRFYNGFSNSVIWPLFHYTPDRVDFSLRYWDEYKTVNQKFAKMILPLCDDETMVWIHDYHLFLLPALLRKQKPNLKIGFFLHIPFPSSEIYRLLPVRKEILKGVLGSDLIGFHTHEYLRHFSSTCLRVLGLETSPEEVFVRGRKVKLGCYPIGINSDEFETAISNKKVEKEKKILDENYKGKKVILGIDRLDYTKGLPQKLEAFETFLENNPKLRNKTVLVQVAFPSRGGVVEYQNLKDQLDTMVGRINGKYGTAGFTPIHYIAQTVPFEQLCALYQRADALLVTSIRDGMNLVSFEYVASQKENAGVLVLSEFAGAAHSFSEALQINPWDRQGVAQAVSKALTMPLPERKRRVKLNMQTVMEFNSIGWARRFIHELRSSRVEDLKAVVDLKSEFIGLRKQFSGKKKRVIVLDYDGTLVPFFKSPEEAVPGPEILKLLGKLVKNKRNEVHVISGREQVQLDKWFSSIPELGLGAEHGLFYREPKREAWQLLQRVPTKWKAVVRPIMESFVKRTPGAFVENKKTALVFHYREADPEFGEWQAHELMMHLGEVLSNLPVEVIQGNKILEVRSQGVNKGSLVNKILERQNGSKPVIVCFGDDRTDEDMFAVLPKGSWTCCVGKRKTLHAKYSLKSPKEVGEVLDELARID